MSAMNELLETLPKHTCSWLQNKVILYKYQDFWTFLKYLEGAILAQKSFEAKPTDVFLCSSMKTGTTWLKALAFSIVTRDKFNNSNSPLRTSLPHDCVPLLETRLNIVQDNQKHSSLPLVATHLPYVSLPESVISSKCKIVYVYRNTKDVIASYYHFRREALKIPINEAPFEEAFEEFYQGLSVYGPYWNHILGYWKASIERPNHVMLFKYEDLKKDPACNVKRLADFIGFPFSVEEEKAGVIEKIIEFCSFEHLSNLEVNKSGKTRPGSLENRLYFRKAEDGDWKNLFTDDMKERIDKLMDEKLSETGLVLK